MDIRDYWNSKTYQNTSKTWEEFCSLRSKTFAGFSAIETSQGYVNPAVSASSSHGQEIVRILAMRVLEELGEAHQSEVDDHFFEELIDAFNYLLSLQMYLQPDDQLSFYLQGTADDSLGKRWEDKRRKQFLMMNLGECTIALGATLGDQLRNRAWMQNVQNTYFDGNLHKILYPVYCTIFSYFENMTHFGRYFKAKDDVLQFRLRSNY